MAGNNYTTDTRLTPPWAKGPAGQQQQQQQQQQPQHMPYRDQEGLGHQELSPPMEIPASTESPVAQSQNYTQQMESSNHFVTERSKVHTVYIVEQEKSKRLGMVLSVVLLISAMLIVLFAPEDKEVISYWMGVALVIFSAGSAGYKRIWGESSIIKFEAEDGDAK